MWECYLGKLQDIQRFKGSMTQLQSIVGDFEEKKGHCNAKLLFMMANYEIVEFIAIMQRLIDKFTIYF